MTKEQIREYIRFENLFGESPWGGFDKETKHPLYIRYRRRFQCLHQSTYY